MAAPILLCDTAGMSNDRWLECRMHGPKGDIPYTIGGSDVAAIFGVSPWTTPLELWLIKKGRMKPKPKDNREAGSPIFCWVLFLLTREGNGNPRQYSCLENPMDGGAW